MAFWNRNKTAGQSPAIREKIDPAPEQRARISEQIASGAPGFDLFFGGGVPLTDEPVSIEIALQVPAIAAAVGFLSRTLATLPIKAYERGKDGRQPVSDDPLARLMGRAANEETSGFAFRQGLWQDYLTAGRGVAFIERNGAGDPINLWPLDVSRLSLERRGGKTYYHYSDGARRITYPAADVIDLVFMPGADRLSARSPVYSNAGTIGLAIAITRYGARLFKNGGIPPFTLSGPISTPGGVARASEELTRAVARLANEGGNAITLPSGHTLTALGIDPEKMQMIEAQRFMIEQIARIYGLPPVFLQDLSKGTFSNTEQQDLHLVKHLIAQMAGAFEAEINLKFYGRARPDLYAEHVLDGLMRGDIKTRAEALAARINTGQLTPNEARELENRPAAQGGDRILVQGAMIPADMAGAMIGATEGKPE